MIDEIDSPETIGKHRAIILKKPFLKKVYLDFYGRIIKGLPANVEQGKIVELGSGAGFLKEVLPHVTTSDVVAAQGIDQVFQAEHMPFADQSIDAFVMLNCFHHFQDAEQSLLEINRCLKTGGKVVMVEPANTWLRRMIDHMFHREPFDTKAGWTLHIQGRLSGANGALPWIVFIRDRTKFEEKFTAKGFNINYLSCQFVP